TRPWHGPGDGPYARSDPDSDGSVLTSAGSAVTHVVPAPVPRSSGMPSSAVILGLGALLYALALGALGLTFDATPLMIGGIALAAAVLGRAPRLTATALTLIGWGAAVMLTRHGPVPDQREAAAFLVGAGLGLLTARLVARARAGVEVGEGSTVLVAGGLAFYLAFDADWLYDWPIWAALLVGWGVWEWIDHRRTGTATATGAGATPAEP
nr:hypothetical protein [Actinomycetota bacterium]